MSDQKTSGEPVAWYTDDHLMDKSATTYDRTTMDRWKAKGWPVTPMYLSPEAPASLLSKGFTTLETGDGKYRIITSYQNRDDAWSDYTALCKAEQPDRSPESYAIEHAEYMAKSADDVLAKFQTYGLALLAVDEGGDDGEGELFENIDSARGDMQEALVDLRSMGYEFRKRSAKS